MARARGALASARASRAPRAGPVAPLSSARAPPGRARTERRPRGVCRASPARAAFARDRAPGRRAPACTRSPGSRPAPRTRYACRTPRRTRRTYASSARVGPSPRRAARRMLNVEKLVALLPGASGRRHAVDPRQPRGTRAWEPDRAPGREDVRAPPRWPRGRVQTRRVRRRAGTGARPVRHPLARAPVAAAAAACCALAFFAEPPSGS